MLAILAAFLAAECHAAEGDDQPVSWEDYLKDKPPPSKDGRIVDPVPVAAGSAWKPVSVPKDSTETGVAAFSIPVSDVAISGRKVELSADVPPDFGGTAHFGVVPLGDPSAEPVLFVKVQGARIEGKLVFALDLGLIDNVNRDFAAFRRNGGGVVAYRIAFASAAGGEYWVDGRFACRDGKRVPAIVDGPWVDMVAQNSAVVWFATDAPCQSEAVLGDRTVTRPETSTVHEFKLGGLQPGTTYKYSVAPQGGFQSGPFRFRTPDRNEINFEFAYMAGSESEAGAGERCYRGVNREILRRLALAASERGADFMVFGGGYSAMSGTPADFRTGLRAWKLAVEGLGAQVPIYEVAGGSMARKEYRVPGRKEALFFDQPGDRSTSAVFAEEFRNPDKRFPYPETDGAPQYRGSAWYFDYGNARVIAVDTGYWTCSMPEKHGGNLAGYLMTRQVIWMQEVLNDALQSREVDHVFVVGYSPAFPNGGKAFESMWHNGGKTAWGTAKGEDRKYASARRDEFWKALSANPKVVCALFGGEGNYSRMLVDAETGPEFARPVWHVNSGAAGGFLHTRSDWVPWASRVACFECRHHYCLVKVRGMKVFIEAYGHAGDLMDRARLR